jgi:hypothetical protein
MWTLASQETQIHLTENHSARRKSKLCGTHKNPINDDNMQLAEKSREKILTIKGNTHDGYDVIFKDGRTVHCKTKLERKCLAQDNKSLAQDT